MTERRNNESNLSGVVYGFVVMTTLFAMLVFSSCNNEPEIIPQGRPVVERGSVQYMLPPVDRAHTAVLKAEEALLEDPPNIDSARESLGKARGALANLQWLYLPATQAREDIYNAYMEQLAGHPERRDAYLDSAKQELSKIAERSGPQVESFIKDLADRIENVQFHIQDGKPIDSELKSLCEVFQLHLLKAQLVLDGNAFEEQE